MKSQTRKTRVEQFQTLLKTTEAAKALGIGKRTLAELISERKIAFIKIGRSVRFAPEDLYAFVDFKRVKAKRQKTQKDKPHQKSLGELIAENL
jgi:excisionase family DNA binding protein